MLRDCVFSRSSVPSTEIESGTSITDCATFCAVTITSSRFVASCSWAHAEVVPSAAATAAATPTSLKLGVIAGLPALLGHDYSDTDTNVLFGELSTGFCLRGQVLALPAGP